MTVILPRRYGDYVTSVDPLSVRYPREAHEWPDYLGWWTASAPASA
jgi:hypothetical protein